MTVSKTSLFYGVVTGECDHLKAVFCFFYYLNIKTSNFTTSDDSCTEGSIDLKCKERVTDSDEDEPDGQVVDLNHNSPFFTTQVNCFLVISRIILDQKLLKLKMSCLDKNFLLLSYILIGFYLLQSL